jgi:hypothetical protein
MSLKTIRHPSWPIRVDHHGVSPLLHHVPRAELTPPQFILEMKLLAVVLLNRHHTSIPACFPLEYQLSISVN